MFPVKGTSWAQALRWECGICTLETQKQLGSWMPGPGREGKDECPDLLLTSSPSPPELAHHGGPEPGPGAVSARAAAHWVW